MNSSAFDFWLNNIGAENFSKQLMESCRQALFVIDANGNILYWNTTLQLLSGLTEKNVLGKAAADIFKCSFQLPPPADKLLELPGTSQQPAQSCRCQLSAFYKPSGQFNGGIVMLQPLASLELLKPTQTATRFHGILTCDPVMQELLKLISNVAETDATVLIRGESGSGKELVARALHLESPRSQQPFLAINCAALTPSLLESELFGHVKGAFTGAIRSHAGLFQRADGGTLFLDEVAELPLELQAKLLRVLQEQSFLAVGGDTPIKVDVRIVAATHRSLREAVKSGLFREDLMYRLRVVPIFLPPLRERRLDIKLLLWHYIQQHNLQGRRQIETINPAAMRCLLDYPWPGNVRELTNVIEYAFAVGRGTELNLDQLPPEFRESTAYPSPQTHPAPALIANEAERIAHAVQQSNGNLEQAAKLLGISRATLWRKRKKYQVE